MDLTNTLKFSYRGLMSYIRCDVGTSYEHIVNMVMARFNIPRSWNEAILISNGNGQIFDKLVLENFLLYFRSPQIIFYIRLDNTKIPTPFGRSKLNNKRSHQSSIIDDDLADYDNNNAYYAAPVHRQNCFLIIPVNANDEQSAAGFKEQIAKRIRLMQTPKTKRTILTKRPKLRKRSLRI